MVVQVKVWAQLALDIGAYFADSCGKVSERSGFSGCSRFVFLEVSELRARSSTQFVGFEVIQDGGLFGFGGGYGACI